MIQPPGRLPDHTAGQHTDNPLTDSVIEAAVRDAIHQTSFRDETPLPTVGDTPPVAQPGRPPMSQRATDASTLMLSGGVASVLVGGAVSLVMWTSGEANSVVVGIVFGAPTTLLLALGRVLRRAGQSMPDEHHHHHYEGLVHQEHSHTTNNNRWWGKSSTRS
ncbi:hypothetical protein [Streptomyces indicus]|uniref:Uncharacterized protein n=1 Tax=Streptomyces indicus TaxID=417292 RepID=A0A1G9ISB2_9ACTN|nr:hypothetical protein [Streptomyces indicus]SDL28209.1 hypothetical protein SAMN05421806_12548 [Streptomyces indicus]